MSDDAIFSTMPPIPARHVGKTPPPEVEAKQKRKYTRKPQKKQPTHSEPADGEDVMLMVESLFEPTQVANYHMIKSFIELQEMVAPENRNRLAMILEGLISK